MRWAALVAVVMSLVSLGPSPASARKVHNPGTYTFTVQTGEFQVRDNSFSFDQNRQPMCSDGSNNDSGQDNAVDFPADPQCSSSSDDSEVAGGFQPMTPVTLTGTVDGAGNINIPTAGIVFPPQYIYAEGVITVRIQPLSAATGNINPLNGAAVLSLSVRVKLEGSPSGISLGGSCFISPINITNATTGSSGPVTGVPYNAATGRFTVAQGTYSVPGADGCGPFGAADSTINSELGLPSPSGNNTAVLGLVASPIVAPAITANFTASPGTSGQAPFGVTFSGSGSTATAGIASYQFDFTNNGSFDALATPPNTQASHTYSSPGSFTAKLRVTDVEGDFVEKTLPITVTVNQPPTANPQTVTTAEDTPVAITLTGSDPAGDPLTFSIVAGSGPSHGALAGTPPNVTYTPASGFNGTDSFQFRAHDPAGNTSAPATVTINVSPVNDPPTVEDESVNTAEDTSVAVTVDATDPDGDTLVYEASDGPSNGVLSGSGPSYTYAPAANFNGADSFEVIVNDGNGGTDSALVSIDVSAVNDAPVANNQAVSTQQDTAVSFTLDATDVDGDNLSYAFPGPPAHGTISGTAPNLTYTPDPGFFGSDSLTYAVSDGNGGTDTATVSISVAQPGNDPPVANDQTVSTTEDDDVSFTLDATDPNDDPLSVTILAGPDNGTLSGSGLNRTYQPDTGFSGSDTFTYSVDDGRGGSDSATVTIEVASVNDAPTATDQSFTTDEDTSVVIVLGATDPDGDELTYDVGEPSGGSLSGTAPNLLYTPDPDDHGLDTFSYEACDPDSACAQADVTIAVTSAPDDPIAADQVVETDEDLAVDIVLDASDGDEEPLTFTIADAPDIGTLSGVGAERRYTPAANSNGSDSFTYSACDPANACDSATVSIVVKPVNDAPTTQSQSVVTAEDTSVPVTLVAGDVDGDEITFELTSEPDHGTLTGSTPNLTYAPDPDFFGNDSFTYAVDDGKGGTDGATVFLGVFSVQDAPIAIAQTVDTEEDTPADIVLTGTDADGDDLDFFIERGPLHGSLAGVPPNVTYAPFADYTGVDNFEFSVRDTTGRSSRATVQIQIDPAALVATQLVAQPAVVEITPLRVLRGFEARLTRTDTQAALPNRLIEFFIGSTRRCSARTNADGVARCSPAPSTMATASKYQARFAGDADFVASSAEAPITRVP